MSKIKLCGLSRPCDMDYVNEAGPDFCGFIINVPKSRRNVTPETLRKLRPLLREGITPVGVFVNAPQEDIVSLVKDNVISVVQLHGQEDEEYIAALREKISVPIIQAFKVASREDVEKAVKSSADYILLDNGSGGTGKTFDWSLLDHITRPFILAGGLGPDNLEAAVKALHPWAVDLSSGVETEGYKDRDKMIKAVSIVRSVVTEK
jgi:phosphoribosylanthranilate isomerase